MVTNAMLGTMWLVVVLKVIMIVALIAQIVMK